jgi:hypothetical protein
VSKDNKNVKTIWEGLFFSKQQIYLQQRPI